MIGAYLGEEAQILSFGLSCASTCDSTDCGITKSQETLQLGKLVSVDASSYVDPFFPRIPCQTPRKDVLKAGPRDEPFAPQDLRLKGGVMQLWG